MNYFRCVVLQSLSALFSLASLGCYANADHISFPNGASIKFTSSLTPDEQKMFGHGWKVATYTSTTGEKLNLFSSESLTSSGGVIFDDSYPPSISPTGKYVEIIISRTGVVEPGPNGKAIVHGRQYCPVLDTRTGCVLSNQDGELCEGEWDKHSDRWIVRGLDDNASTPMLQYQFEDANDLWEKYFSAKDTPYHYSIREAIASNLGAANLMACDPLKKNNAESYKRISDELKRVGDIEEAGEIARKLKSRVILNNRADVREIVSEKAYLFDEPDAEHQTKMYLIRGDQVRILAASGRGWAKIQYIEKNGRVIEKWVPSDFIK